VDFYVTGVAASSAGGVGTNDLVPEMPPTLEHAWVACEHRHRVDMVRRAIYAMEAQRVLVFMNFQQRLKVGSCPFESVTIDIHIRGQRDMCPYATTGANFPHSHRYTM
jgi:hypothetical protein